MRHRAQTPLARALSVAASRRGLAAGAVVLVGGSTGVGLLTQGSFDVDTDRPITSGPLGDRRGSTTYPGAAALETLSASRTQRPSRGHARTDPSPSLSSAPDSPASTSAPTPAPAPATTSRGETDEPPPSSAPPTTSPSPSRSTPTASPPSPREPAPAPSAPAPAPAGPETSAVTDLAAAGTWTVVVNSDRPASFECSLDGGAYSPCGPVVTFTGLSQGRHTLSVRAIDSAGAVDPTPAVLTTTVTGPTL